MISRMISRMIKFMGRRINPNIRKLQNPAGKSYTVSIPIDFIRFLKWREHQKVVFELDKRRKRIIIKDWKK